MPILISLDFARIIPKLVIYIQLYGASTQLVDVPNSGGEFMGIKIKLNCCRKVLFSTVGIVMMYLPIQQSFAQLEEIVVTSRRFEESITNAPLAVAVMDWDFLTVNRVNEIQDVLDLTPGAMWTNFVKAQPNLSLRGIPGGTYGNASLESSVQVVYDGVPITKAFMMTMPFYDLARVEIMRGPQGTSFGRNASLGLMHFVSARPSQETSGSIEGTVGERNLLGFNGYYNTALSETVSGRIAFNYNDFEGPLEHRVTGEALEGGVNKSVRASLLYEPTDSFSAYLKAEVIKDDDLTNVFRGPADQSEDNPWTRPPFGNYTDGPDIWTALQDDGRDFTTQRDITVLTAELVWNMDDLAVTWLSGFQEGEHHSAQSILGTPFALRDQLVDNDAQVLSTELRIDNVASGDRLTWIAGVSLLKDEETRFEENIGMPERGDCGGPFRKPGGCPEWHLLQTGDATSTSYGIFAEVGFDITEQLNLTVGGRYTKDTRDMNWSAAGYGEVSGLRGLGAGNGARDCGANAVLDPLGRQGQGPSPAPARVCGSPTNLMGFDISDSNSWDDFSPKVSLNYALNDNNNIYALYSEGFKSGGYQHDARTPEQFALQIEPENVTNYEIGWKGSYDRARFAVTVFSMEQSNSQVGTAVAFGTGSIALFVNSGAIENKGIELEGTFQITDNFTAGGNAAFYNSEFLEGTETGGFIDPETGIRIGGEDISGSQPPGTPESTATLWAAYDWALPGGSSVRLRGDWRYRSTSFFVSGVASQDGLNLTGTGRMYERPELNKLGLDLSWTSADAKLSVSLWGRNLDNEADVTIAGPPIGFIYNRGQPGPLGETVVARPSGFTGRRQIGATVRYNFGG